MRETVYGEANPVDALDNNQNIRVCFDEDTIAEPLGCGEPVKVIAQAPVGVVQNTTADLERKKMNALGGEKKEEGWVG